MGKKNDQFVEEYVVAARYDEDGVQASSAIGKDGKEYPDPVPMSPPIGYNAPPDIMTLIRRMVRAEEFARAADKAGFETFEEAEDFDVDDDPWEPLTDYEKVFEPSPVDGPAKAAPSVSNGVSERAEGTEGAVASPPPVTEEVKKDDKHSTST